MELVDLIIGAGYIGIVAVIFAESGLLIGFFFPGDSLLFTAGFLASMGTFDIRILVPLCAIAAIFGDSVGYAFGRRVGPKVFTREDSLVFHRDHLERARRFYAAHGAKTIILARFMPIVRTFAPVLAGVGVMRYATFLTYNVVGAIAWAAGIPLLGYIIGQTIPNVDRYLVPIVLAIILISVAPGVWHILGTPEGRARAAMVIRTFLRRVRRSA